MNNEMSEAKELNDLWGDIQHVRETRPSWFLSDCTSFNKEPTGPPELDDPRWEYHFYREREKQFIEKLIEERAKHSPETWRKWIKEHCVFSERQVRHVLRRYEQATDIALIQASNAGRRSLAWERIKDRVEPHWQRIMEIINSLDPDERTDARCALMEFTRPRLPTDDNEGHPGEDES